MATRVLRFDQASLGRPYHAALVRFGPRAAPSLQHRHADYYEVMAVVEGGGEHCLATGRRPLATGDIVLIRPRDDHAVQALPPQGIGFINVAFPANAWRAFLDLTGADPGNTWDRHAEPLRMPVRDEDQRQLQAAFHRALESYHEGPTMIDLVRFWSDFMELAVAPCAAGTVDPTGPERPAWLARAYAAMRREENLRGGVPRMRELANVSAAHLSRTMQQYYGATPTSFLTDLRLGHAASLLATTAVPVTEIAYRCGFASQSYFSRCFRRAHGMSPRAFRRECRHAFVP